MHQDCLDRISSPYMEFYRYVYKDSPMWSGGDLSGKTLLVYCEQGFGDIIQFSRYFRMTGACKVILHCPRELHTLLKDFADVLIDKEYMVLPEHDYHVLSLSLPFLLDFPVMEIPYLTARPMELGSGFKIGIAWEGNPVHERNDSRSCHLRTFSPLFRFGDAYMLQKQINDHKFVEGCDLDLNGVELGDFSDTASLIAAMDVIVSVDTSVLHLAGALGEKTYGLLDRDHDPRWDYSWYPSVKLLKGDWGRMISWVCRELALTGRG